MNPPLALSLLRGALGVLSRTAPNAASRVAMSLFMKPHRHPRPGREREVLATATRFQVTVDGRPVQAWRWGSGPVVLLVHGWEGRGAQLSAFVEPLTATGFAVVTFDAPGHGESPGARSSLPHFAWSVRAVADAAGGAWAIVAHSLGCAATTLALRDGLTARRLVYFSPPLDPSDYVARFGGILNISTPVLDRMKQRIEERFQRKWSDYSLRGAGAPADSARTGRGRGGDGVRPHQWRTAAPPGRRLKPCIRAARNRRQPVVMKCSACERMRCFSLSSSPPPALPPPRSRTASRRPRGTTSG